ncbi:Fic family protein [Bifidobacterium sp. ESL0800]|uniref:Fic family protein n=1 Tax=Bifidobacterium sp. ESL0800 TaxID=2983236 RepID=UPI0023F6EFDF|nr:Fic family protein [Bifidobacterium sp. ESL0800]WEV76402.1 Fic family protein [Bifidobacterium sp. ESL0800]
MVMTPAERASAVAFSYKNCELSGIVVSDAMVMAANGYQRGTIALSDFAKAPERHAQRPSQKASAYQKDEDDNAGEHSSVTVAHSGGRIDNGQHDQADISTETQLRDDRIFARCVRLIDYGWPAYGGLDELKTIHRGLFVGAMTDAGMVRGDGGSCTMHGIDDFTNQPNRANDREIHQNRQRQSPYFPASLIATGAANIFSQLGEQDCFSGLDRAGFIRALAGVYDELNALHPFAYGNGMVLRMFVSELTHAVGWDLNWGTVTFESYRKATGLALLEHDISGLERMFASIIRLANPTRIFLISGWDQGPAH